MIKRLVFFLLFAIGLSENESRVSMLISRKSYFIPMRTKFILKCSTSKFGDQFNDLSKNDLNKDDQFDDDQPELIALNNVKQIKKLIDYFNKLNQVGSSSKIEKIVWNKTKLNNFKLNGNSFDKKFNRLYEDMYLSGKSFYQPNENETLLNTDKSCLLFTSFTKKDESIYSCFYKPKIENWFTFLFSFDLGSLMSLDSNLDNSINYKRLKDLNLNNRISLNEKLIYMTCLLTWPFNQECYLVKQFKLQVEPVEYGSPSADYWSGLDSNDQIRLRSLLKQLIKHCHRVSNGRSYVTNKNKKSIERRTDDGQNHSNFIKDGLTLFFDDLFVDMLFKLVNDVLNSFSNDWINGLFNNFLINSVSDMFNELIIERFVDLFKDLNLFYLIYILLFLFIYFSLKSNGNDEDGKAKRKKGKIKRIAFDMAKKSDKTSDEIKDDENVSFKYKIIFFLKNIFLIFSNFETTSSYDVIECS